MSSRTLLAAAILALVCQGCSRGGGQDGRDASLLELGEQLVLEARFDEAVPLLKEHLLRYPLDPGGHYYLGRCYLNVSDPWLFPAEGELRTALMLFRDRGHPNTIERFDDAYFELSIHLEIAKIYLRQFEVMQQIGAPQDAQRALVARMQEEADRASALAPDSGEVAQLKALIEHARAIVEGDPRRLPPVTPPGAPLTELYAV